MAGHLGSNELNLLVYKYLVESGFQHSAFTFGYESMVHRNGVQEKDIPPAGLISFVQKGIQYLELETNLNEEGLYNDADFQSLTPMELVSKTVPELRAIIQDRRERREEERHQMMERLAQSAEAGPREILGSQVQFLTGHGGEVFSCCWNPTENLLASGSGDKTARIWEVSSRNPSSVELHHPLEKEKDVTTLDWNPDGSLLATGSYDGLARIWTKDGVCQQSLMGHAGPIFSLKWNKKGDLLLTGSLDRTAIVWNAKAGAIKQQFSFHSAPILDVDWKSSNIFATSSSDKTIHIAKVGEESPIKSFVGHTDEVNCIKWDPQGKLLVSCSDDTTAKVWTLSQDTCVFDLRQHTKEIYTVKWAPLGPNTANPHHPQLLATASFDTTIRLWEMERGECVRVLKGHTQAVYSLAFSPDGKYLASGSFDKRVIIWSIPAGKLVRTFEASGGIFEVCWNKDGDLLAACTEDKLVTVLNLRA